MYCLNCGSEVMEDAKFCPNLDWKSSCLEMKKRAKSLPMIRVKILPSLKHPIRQTGL